MPDLSKHLLRAKQAIERRGYDLAIEICLECQEVDPANLENLNLLLEAAKRRAKAGGGKGFIPVVCLSSDPQKKLSSALKRMAKSPDLKSLAAAGEAAQKAFESGAKSLLEVGIVLYEEAKATGLFNEPVLWNLAHLYLAKFDQTKEKEPLNKAIITMEELARAVPSHPQAKRLIKNWEAMRSMTRRGEAQTGQRDFRGQLATDDQARRSELMNRIIRSAADADEVLALLNSDLASHPDDKSLYLKKGDVLRRVNRFDQAIEVYEKAQNLDPADFVITMRMGDLRIAMAQDKVDKARQAGGNLEPLEAELMQIEVEEYRRRIERQPTEMSHHFNLGVRLLKQGEIDSAASELQQAVHDPRFRRQSHLYLGHCFLRKKLLDLSRDQYSSCLSLIEDQLSEEYKEVAYHRAKACLAMGDRQGAIDDLTRVVKLDLAYRDAASLLNKLRDRNQGPENIGG